MTRLTVTNGEAALVDLDALSQYVARVRRVGDTEWSRISAPRLPGVAGGAAGVSWATPPQSQSDPGSVGDVAYDNAFFYVYTDAGWRRASLGGWDPEITITAQPQDLTLGVGGSGNFTISATVSDGSTPSYQWQNSDDNGATWDTITGSTGATYGLSGVSGADNGTVYRAVVSAAGAVNVTSDSATLTVGETSHLLTESSDTLLTEAGEVLNHDGVGGGGGGGNNNPTNDWEQAGVAFDTQGLIYAYSADADVAYGWTATTSSSGWDVYGLQRYERTNGAWLAVGSTRHTGVTVSRTPLPIAVSSDGSRVIAVSQASQLAVDPLDYGYAGYRVYDYANQTLAVAYSGAQGDFELAAVSGDGNAWAVYTSQGDVLVYSSAGLIGTVVISVGLINTLGGDREAYRQHLAINYDGTRVAFSAYGDVTGDGNADASTRVFQWTGVSWSQMGGAFVSPANALGGMPRQPVAFSSDGSRIAIGFSTDTLNTLTQCGVVRVYDWTGSAWVQAGSDLAGSAPYEFFGSSLSLSSDGTRLAIGAIGDDSSATNSGRSVVYQYSAGEWFQIGTDIDGPAATNAYAGSSSFLSSDGNYLGVGASGLETLTRYELQSNEITITQQPQSVTWPESAATFTVSATVSDLSSPSYQWEASYDNGNSWTELNGETSNTLTLSALNYSYDGYQYRAVVSAARAPDATSDAATLTVVGQITVTQQPADVTANGSTIWSQAGADIDGEAAGDYSGRSVALSSDGSRVAIGAYLNDGNGVDSGHVRIFDWSGSAWVQVGTDIDGEAAGDYSGYSVALSSDGSRVAIGAIYNDGYGTQLGQVRIYDWSGSAWVQVGTDIHSNVAYDRSGYSVALSSDGSRVAIGAPQRWDPYKFGQVRILEWSGSAWVQVGSGIDGQNYDYSGWSVALSSDGSRVAIGAYGNDGNGVDSGRVRIYDWSGSAWVQIGADIDGEAANDYSGWSVALSSDGSRVAIGAYGNDGTGTDAGHVRIYDWSGSAWVQVGSDIDGEAAGDYSGYSVALSSDGSRVAIGAWGNEYINDGSVNNAGHVRIYDWSGSAWVRVAQDIDGEAAGDHSGYSVALSSDGSRVAIGAPTNDNIGGGTDSGHVRVYDLTTTTSLTLSVSATSNDGSPLLYQWQKSDDGITFADVAGATSSTLSLTGLTNADDDGDKYRVVVDSATADSVTSDAATLTVNSIAITQQPAGTTAALVNYWSQVGTDIDGEAAGDESGYSVALSSDGSRVAIGARFNDGSGSNAGHVRIYDWSGSGWVQVGADINGDASLNWSGYSVALSSDGSRVAIGSILNDHGGIHAGHVRIYDWSGSAWVQVGADINGEAAVDYSGYSVALSSDGNRVAIGAISNDGGGAESGHVRTYDWSGSAWVKVGQDIDGEAAGDNSGHSVALSSDGSRLAIGAPRNEGDPLQLGSNDGHVRIYDWSGSAWVQVGQDIDGETTGDQSGFSVSLSSDGSRVAIGAPYSDSGNTGHVRIYELSGTVWVQVGVDIDGEASGDYSGNSVALSSDGSRVAIGGASLTDSSVTNAGRVRIYDWSGSAWVKVAQDIDGEASGDYSGTSVALSSDGSRVAIGAPYNDGSGSNSGHVRVFDLSTTPSATFSVSATSIDGSSLTYQWEKSDDGVTFAYVTGATSSTLSLTGLTAVDDGDQYRVVVDSPSSLPVTSDAATLTVNGIAITQQPAGTTAALVSSWSQVGTDIDGEAAGDWSGWSVALSSDGSRVAIGAPDNDGVGFDSGHVRIYDWSGSAWVQVGADIDGEAANDRSGTSVALSSDGSRVAIGAHRNDGNGGGSGHVRIYDWSGSSWVKVGADIDGEAASDRSGTSVALSSDGSRVAIGAPYNDGGIISSGHVRIYDWSGSAWVQVGADIDGETGGDESGHSVALSSDGSRVAIGARYNDGGGTSSGHVRIYDWSGAAWVQVGADIDGEAADDISGISVAISSDGSRVAIGAPYNDGNGVDSGHVRIYDWSGSAWVQVGSDIDGEAAGDRSGTSVALSSDGSRVAIGAPYNDGGGTDSGHVRVFDPPGTASATFSVSATASDSSTLTYQWEKSDDGVTFANVSGATSATLTLTGLTAADDNGDQYRVIVDSATAEAVTSNIATLTVT